MLWLRVIHRAPFSFLSHTTLPGSSAAVLGNTTQNLPPQSCAFHSDISPYSDILLQVKSFQYINILTCHLYCWCLTCSLMLFSKNCSVIAVSTSSSCKIGSKLLLSVAFVPIGLNFFFELNWFQASISI